VQPVGRALTFLPSEIPMGLAGNLAMHSTGHPEPG
jgi:hypothetical protein